MAKTVGMGVRKEPKTNEELKHKIEELENQLEVLSVNREELLTENEELKHKIEELEKNLAE